MIECTDKNIYYKRKRKKGGWKKVFSLFLVAFFIVFLFLYFKYIISPNLINICVDKTKNISTKVINEVSFDVLNKTIKYDDLINVEKNSNGDITLIYTNTNLVNELSLRLSDEILNKLENELLKGVKIPLFAFTGIKILSGYGSEVNFKSFIVSNVKCNLREKFTSSGINQTIHTLYLDIECEFALEIPLNHTKEFNVNSIMLTEGIIIGKIPNVYLN